MLNRQNQTAGDYANQFQAKELTVHIVGIDEKRAREICDEKLSHLKSEYTEEALVIANTRIKEFENSLLPKMQAVNGALEAFADPSFQLLLVEAQKAAASTERPEDYDLLSELLIHRFQKGENRMTRAGISRAVKIVDEIADDALLGLTVFHIASEIFPTAGDIYTGLDMMNGLFSKLLYDQLPVGQDWLEHLDILGAVRINSSGSLKDFEIFYSEILTGYIDVGIEKESEEFGKAIEILQNNNIPEDIFIEHSLNKNFMRLSIINVDKLDSIVFYRTFKNGQTTSYIPYDATVAQKAALQTIYKLYKQDEGIKQENINRFKEEFNKRENLKIISNWWNNLSIAFKVTSVGIVLAHSNAQRCEKDIPPLP